MKLHIVRIHQNEEVMPALHAYMSGQVWQRGIIMGAAGSVYHVTVNCPVTNEHPPVLKAVTIEEPCEMASLFGEVIRREDTPDNLQRHMHEQLSPYMIHAHCSVAHGEDCAVHGGGLRGMKVFSALNVYIMELDGHDFDMTGFENT